MTSIIIGLCSLSFVCLLTIVLAVLGQHEDRGYSTSQKLVRSWFRLSRWTYAQAKGWDVFLVHYRRAVSARRIEIQSAMQEPLPELGTPAVAQDMAREAS